MRFLKRRAKIERTVYASIDEIAENLDLEIPYYPEVYWTGRSLDFYSLGLPIYLKKEFDIRKIRRKSYFLSSPGIIFIGKESLTDQVEEAAHFLHATLSKINYKRKSIEDCVSIWILDEMLAYLSSKFVIPERINPYGRYKDYTRMKEKGRKDFLFQISRYFYQDFDLLDFNIYQQGYGLGETIFCEYCSGRFSLEEMRKLFLQNFEGNNEASSTFIRLKCRFGNLNSHLSN
ncbi:hypothetical protein HYW75_04040 [Candidatus Pacearchaeota archaeon]|nr:hypothetical protein [Candidatus Pacearchaeota archaeon]